MQKYIAILRGINVGTGRKVPMADLKVLCTKLGLVNPETYIQSGNLIFELSKNEPIPELEEKLHKSCSQTFGFDIPVIIRTTEEWAESIAKNPFMNEENVDIDRLHLTFLKEQPSDVNFEKISSLEFLPDRFQILEKEVFVYCENGYGRSKITNDFFEKKLKVPATTRNWKTVIQLNELSKK